MSCFTERKDSILMWSHYSDQNKGICIEIEFNVASEAYSVLEPVIYARKMALFPSFKEASIKRTAVRTAAITKSIEWEYEKEWRLIFDPKEVHHNLRYYRIPKPKAIYLGIRFAMSDIEFQSALMKYSELNEVPLIQLKMHNTAYKIIQ